MFEKQITPSILNVEKEERPDVIKQLIDLGIKWFHYDVMDGQFVENTAITIEEIISFYHQLPKHLCDVHLMVQNPIEYAQKLKDFTTCITVHYEAFANDQEIINFVNEFSNTNWVGISIKPNTSFSQIQHLLHLFDLVLVMSVEPGKGGQPFIETSYEKVIEIAKFIEEEKLPTIIQVDGGINDANSKKLFETGATFNVVGSFLMKNLNAKTLKNLKIN